MAHAAKTKVELLDTVLLTEAELDANPDVKTSGSRSLYNDAHAGQVIELDAAKAKVLIAGGQAKKA